MHFHDLMECQAKAKRSGFFGDADLVAVRMGTHEGPIHIVVERRDMREVSVALQDKSTGSISHCGQLWRP